MKLKSLLTFYELTFEVWNTISAKITIKNFKATSISNKIDRTKLDMIYENNKFASYENYNENSRSNNKTC